MKRLFRLIGSFEKGVQKITPTDSPTSVTNPISMPGHDLLAPEYRKKTVVLIKRALSVTPEVWEDHYLYALSRFAELVQDHPASRQHHHSEPGGLLDHTLEVTLRALRLSSGVILPPGAEPEELLHNAERWRFGVFVCALLHDIGKVIGDQETVYKDESGKFNHWQAWHGPIPFGSEYVYRYRQTHGEHIHGLHEKLGITLLPFLLTHSTSKWLTSDRKLLGQMMNTLSASATGAGIIGELIRKADRSSTADNLSPTTGMQSGADRPLHAKILEALQTLANEGKLKRNMPGAGLWVSEEYTYIVAKSTMEKVRDHLLAAGHKSIPQSPLRLMQILNEHGISTPPVDSGDSQQAVVNDVPRSWSQKLSFVVIPNETLWVSGTPNKFAGTITPVDSKGNEVSLATREASSPDEPDQAEDIAPTPAQTSDNQDLHEELAMSSQGGSVADPSTQASQKHNSHSEKVAAPSQGGSVSDPMPKESSKEPTFFTKKPVKVVSRTQQKKPAYKSKPGTQTSPLRAKNELIAWLLGGIKYRRIRVNESGAPIHIIGNHVAFITPKVFDLYLDDNKSKAIVYGSTRNKQLVQLQREFKSLDVHLRNGGEDFHRIAVRGPRKESTVSALLVERSYFPELDSFSENPILERATEEQ